MIIYTITIEGNKAMDASFHYNGKSTNLKLSPDNSSCIVDQLDYLFRYGFEINDLELNYYKAHYAIWQHFSNYSQEDICLICEKTVSFNARIENFLELNDDLPNDWEVFFPFDQFNETNRYTAPEICVGKLGYFVGCPVYFMSKKGAAKLLSHTTIRQPLDEELLSLSLSDQLVTDFSDTGWFTYDYHSSPCFLARKAALSKAIFTTQGWTDNNRATARKIIKQLVSYCSELGVDLVLHAGSLIGGIRHGEIMPWDDDIDFAVHHLQIQQLITKIQEEGLLQIQQVTFKKTNSVFYKCWMKEEGEITEGFEHRFPFVDLWLFYDNEEAGYVIHKEGHRYPKHICMPFKKMYFEGSEVQIPNDSLATLDLQYPGWREYIEIYAWCHRLKKHAFKKMKLRIQVNEEGRLIPEEPAY